MMFQEFSSLLWVQRAGQALTNYESSGAPLLSVHLTFCFSLNPGSHRYPHFQLTVVQSCSAFSQAQRRQYVLSQLPTEAWAQANMLPFPWDPLVWTFPAAPWWIFQWARGRKCPEGGNHPAPLGTATGEAMKEHRTMSTPKLEQVDT